MVQDVARKAVGRQIMAGLFDLGRRLDRDRERAIDQVPAGVRTAISTGIDDALRSRGYTHDQARTMIGLIDEAREGRVLVTMTKLRNLL